VRFGVVAFCFAHRAFCARLILLRSAAGMVRDAPFELTLPKAARAASMRWTWFCARSRSFFNSGPLLTCVSLRPPLNDSKTARHTTVSNLALGTALHVYTYGWRIRKLHGAVVLTRHQRARAVNHRARDSILLRR
jgi:hypothetical protein